MSRPALLARVVSPHSALIAALAIVVAWGVAFWPFTIDDTYIAARYAENLAAGDGPVFTPGERVEGFSCPAWVATLAVAAAGGLDPIRTSKVLGLAAALAIVGLMYTALRRSGTPSWLVAAATLWVAALPGFAVYAASGMETVPFALAVLLVTVTPLLGAPCRVRAGLAASGILLVATLRPEGVPIGIGAAACWLVTDRSRSVRVAVTVALLVLGALLVARFAYYGSWLPNTYYAKPSVLLAEVRATGGIGGAVRLVRALVAGVGPRELIGAVGGPLVMVLAIAAIVGRPRDARLWPALCAISVGWIFVAYAPADWMPAARFATPFAPAVIVLAALGAGAIGRAPRVARIACAVGVSLFVVWQAAAVGELRRAYVEGRMNPALDARAFLGIGEWLGSHAAPHDRVLAYEVGAIGYASGCAIVDHEGLVTADVARIVHRAGGYTAVRFGGAPDALRRLVRACQARRPEWYLVRSSKPVPAVVGQPLPQGSANEPIQNAMLQAFGASMVLRTVFELPAPAGLTERYLLLERAR